MNSFSASAPNTLSLSSSSKLLALEKTLHQSIVNFQEVAKEIEALHLVSEDYKNQFLTQKEKCESKHCSASEALSKVIECKDNIIQSVASAVTRLNETKNFNVIKDIFKILCGDSPITVLKVEPQIVKDEKNNTFNFITPKKELDSTTDITDVTMKDESVSEIEGTPTGRTSPIIQSRKMKNGCVSSSSDHRDKKKCPDSWSTPESKAMKLTFPPNSKRGKWRQGRLSVVTVKSNSVVDLTSSPELMAMNKSSQPETIVQALVKKESTDNDDTILPSPTSGSNNYPSLLKNPIKSESFKRPLCLKNKSEDKMNKCNIENSPKKPSTKRREEPDESINLLKPARFMKMLDENSPIKVQPTDDETHCEIPSSLSILEHHVLASKDAGEALKAVSPSKSPLGENQNILNMQGLNETDASMSLLRPEPKAAKVSPEDKAKRKLPVEPVYKEPTVRKKAEKRALPGWSCDECKTFFDELYQNDHEMLAKKMEECSKHRGRNNPARPKTPEGFWNPRWSVPSDTEEFNRRNNAA